MSMERRLQSSGELLMLIHWVWILWIDFSELNDNVNKEVAQHNSMDQFRSSANHNRKHTCLRHHLTSDKDFVKENFMYHLRIHKPYSMGTDDNVEGNNTIHELIYNV